jgi:hypothetical protein
MPLYNCDCCNFSTKAKTLYTRHIVTKKHLENANKQPADDEGDGELTSKDISESLDMLFDGLDDVKKELADVMADVKKEIAAMKSSLQEYKQLFVDMKNHSPTPPPTPPATPPPPPPQPIIIQTNNQPTEKKATCNPTYHCNALNEDENLKSIEGVDTYFKIAGPVEFPFDELEVESDIRVITKGWIVRKLTDFVRENKENIPFRYYKGSLYYKNEEGSWQRENPPVNKGEKLSTGTYIHSLLVKKFIFIIRNRTIKHLDELLGDRWRLRNFEDLYSLMESEIFNLAVWRNAELGNHLHDLLK